MGCKKLAYHLDQEPSTFRKNSLKVLKGNCPLQKKSGLNYYPFGMVMPSRQFQSGNGYRFGFQGQEKDDEIKGAGNSINYKYRMHDSKLGRFFSIDPLAADYPHNSPYAFSENRLIDAIELEGLESQIIIYNDLGDGTTKITVLQANNQNGFQLVERRLYQTDGQARQDRAEGNPGWVRMTNDPTTTLVIKRKDGKTHYFFREATYNLNRGEQIVVNNPEESSTGPKTFTSTYDFIPQKKVETPQEVDATRSSGTVDNSNLYFEGSDVYEDSDDGNQGTLEELQRDFKNDPHPVPNNVNRINGTRP